MKTKSDDSKSGAPITRRGWFGALAGLAAVVASVTRERTRPETVPQKQRRRFWIGHT